MFRHILCPTDLRERANEALGKAVQIAHQFGARVTLLHCREEFMDREEREMLRVSTEKMKDKFRRIALESKEEMKKVVRRVEAEDLEVEYLIREGKPDRKIVEVAREIGADLIVMATDGRNNLGDFVTGTVTEHVIHSACCPVLVFPRPE